MKPFEKRMTIITGHYGSGKTNLSVNLALDCAALGKKTCIVDLDIINPYFRVADSEDILQKAGVRVIATIHARTNVENPSLTGEVNAVFDDSSYTAIFDVGGDDAGAVALGRYSGRIREEGDYAHYFVINARRALTQTAADAVSILREVEAASRLPVTALVNNTNLSTETDAHVIRDSIAFAREASRLTGLPVAFTSVRRDIARQLADLKEPLYPIDIYVTPPW